MVSPLPYIGGKSRLSKSIVQMIPDHQTYCEVFAGACWVFFRKEESKVEVINDLDSQLVCFFRVLQNLKKNEDDQIVDHLRSESIIKPLKQITGRYNSLRLEHNQLIVSDDYDDFPISELSTGAQEQVLLALRIGFASKPTATVWGS